MFKLKLFSIASDSQSENDLEDENFQKDLNLSLKINQPENNQDPQAPIKKQKSQRFSNSFLSTFKSKSKDFDSLNQDNQTKLNKKVKRSSTLQGYKDLEIKYKSEDLRRQDDLSHKKKFKYIVKFNSKLKILWDIFMILCAVFNSYMIPFCVAFDPTFSNTSLYDYANDTVNYLFILDIILSFRTSRLNLITGEEILNPRLIAQQYVKTADFWFDLISAPPYDKMGSSDAISFFNMLKTIRIMRIGIIIEKLNIKKGYKIVLKLLNIIFLQLITIHIQACLFYYVCTLNKTWLPPSEWELIDATHFYESEDYNYKYWVTIYYSVLIYSVNDIGATAVIERAFVGYMGIFFSIINANIFGLISLLTRDLQRQQFQFHQEIQDAVAAMISFNIPTKNQSVFKNYVRLTQKQRYFPQELHAFLNSISSSLRLKVQIHVLKPTLFSNKHLGPIFQNTYDQSILEKFIEQNDNMYIIAQGVCTVKQKPRGAMIYMSRRSASVYSEYYSILASIEHSKFSDMMQKFPKICNALKQSIAQYKDESQRFLNNALQRVYYLNNLTEDDNNSLIYNFKYQNFEKGNHILSPGDIPDSLMIISSGIVEVYTDIKKGGEFPLEYLGIGGILCHHLFLFKKPVLLPIRCVTKVQVMSLSIRKVEFLLNHNQFSSLNKEIKKVKQDFFTFGFERLFIDILQGFNPQKQVDNEKYERTCFQNKIIKNSFIYLLQKIRNNSSRPQVNEILQNMIMRKKAEIKYQKKQLADLMNRSANPEQFEEQSDILLRKDDVKSVKYFLTQMQLNIDYQGEGIARLKKKFLYSLTEGAAYNTLLKRKKFQQKRSYNMMFCSLEDQILDEFKQNEKVDGIESSKQKNSESIKGILTNKKSTNLFVNDQETDIPQQFTFSNKEFTNNNQSKQSKQSERIKHIQENWDTYHSNHEADESMEEGHYNFDDQDRNKLIKSMSKNFTPQTMKNQKLNTNLQFKNLSSNSEESRHSVKHSDVSFQLNNSQPKVNQEEEWNINKDTQPKTQLNVFQIRKKIEEKFQNEIRHKIEAMGIKIIDDDPVPFHLIDWHNQQNESDKPSEFQSQNSNGQNLTLSNHSPNLYAKQLSPAFQKVQNFGMNLDPLSLNKPKTFLKLKSQEQNQDQQSSNQKEKLVFKDLRKFIAEKEEQKQSDLQKDPNRPRRKKIIYSQSGSTKNQQLWQEDNLNF
eukprot:403361210